MSSPDPAARLQDAAILWSAALAPSTEVVDAACNALVVGLGDMPLAMLAGLCAAEADEGVRDLLPAWVHRTLGHAFGEPLASLDDQYDMEEYTDLTLTEIDAAVITEAQRLTSQG